MQPKHQTVPSKTGNIISLVQQSTSTAGQHIVCSFAKEVELYKELSKPQIKGQTILKRLQMHNSIATNHRKVSVGPFKASLKSTILEIFFEK